MRQTNVKHHLRRTKRGMRPVRQHKRRVNYSSVPLKDASKVTLYHGTKKRLVPAIKKEGLMPYSDVTGVAAVHLTPSLSSATYHADVGPESDWWERKKALEDEIAQKEDKFWKTKEEQAELDYLRKNLNKLSREKSEPAVLKVTLPKEFLENIPRRLSTDEELGKIEKGKTDFYELPVPSNVPPQFIKEIPFKKAEKKSLKQYEESKEAYSTWRRSHRNKTRDPDAVLRETKEEQSAAEEGFRNLFNFGAWDVADATQKGHKVIKMSPEQYFQDSFWLSKDEAQKWIEKYQREGYFDEVERKRLPIEQLSEKLMSPDVNVKIPYSIYGGQEGAHRTAAAAKLGAREIPVIVSRRHPEPMREEFIEKAFGKSVDSYKNEWRERFSKGNPEAHMGGEPLKIYKDLLKKYDVE